MAKTPRHHPGAPVDKVEGSSTASIQGHFVAVDGFGQPSAEERAAGMPQHGEAHVAQMEVQFGREGSVASVAMSGKLPIAQEQFTRTFRMVDGENVIYVDSQLENLLGFDRPVNWAEHATLGAPFLAPGAVVVDFSASRSHTRNVPMNNNAGGRGGAARHLRPDQDFTWPDAPGLDSFAVNLRIVPEDPALHGSLGNTDGSFQATGLGDSDPREEEPNRRVDFSHGGLFLDSELEQLRKRGTVGARTGILYAAV